MASLWLECFELVEMLSTESSSNHTDLENRSISELVNLINLEDKSVAFSVEKELYSISLLANAILEKMQLGGRLFYIGAGTSGRLGILDASECPPTFGVEHGRVIGIIAGGDTAIRKAVEGAEDDKLQGIIDLKKHKISPSDFVVGIAASGATPYVLGALNDCRELGISTGSICCNSNSPISASSKYPVEVVVGPEFISGSTRLKAGTAQKMVLNILTTSVMIKLGKVQGNKMVDMQLSNAKLVERGIRMIMESTNVKEEQARSLLTKYQKTKVLIDF